MFCIIKETLDAGVFLFDNPDLWFVYIRVPGLKYS